MLVRPLDDDRPMMRRTFCSRVENERGVSASSASSSSSSSLFHPRERRLRSDERVDEALRFRECGGGVTSMLVTAADVKLEVADPLSPALVNVTDFEEPSSFSERRISSAQRDVVIGGARSLGEVHILGAQLADRLNHGVKEIL